MSFQATGESWQRTTGPAPRAGFWQRFVADLIDGILLLIIVGIAEHVLHAAGDIIGLLIAFGYFTYFEGGLSGQTPGKRAMRIRVISLQDGQPIGFGRALVRTVMRIVSEIPIFLGYLWMLGSAEKQTWHDMAAGAVVVPADSLPRQPRAPW